MAGNLWVPMAMPRLTCPFARDQRGMPVRKVMIMEV